MNLSCALVFFFIVNIASGYTICRDWTPWVEEEVATPNIVDGIPVNADGDFPYLVSLQYDNGQHACGGSILNKRYILTAAHCFDNKTSFPVRIQYGKVKINPRGPNIVPIQRVKIHENYLINTAQNDIAIVELQGDIMLGRYASPVSLPHPNEVIPESNNMVIMGWGQISETGLSPSQARYTIVSKFTDDYCYSKRVHIQEKYCGGVIQGYRGTCYGDSGGPAMINGKQYGIVSGKKKGIPCGSPEYPDTFTRVPAYRMWIQQYTGV